MGRRSLPKIQGRLDLSRYFILNSPEYFASNENSGDSPDGAVDAPAFGPSSEAVLARESGVDPDSLRAAGYRTFSELTKDGLSEEIFGRKAPLELEIGSGKGLFIAGAAKKSPERNFLGIEIAYRYALMSASRLAKQGSTNGAMINGDAAYVLRELIAPKSLSAAHIYFPDPWWKKAHRKRRIVRPDVVRSIEERLEIGGKLHFWTDVREYFESGVEIIKLSTKLVGPFVIPERPANGELDYQTHFERRTRLNKAPVYRSYFVRVEE